MKKLLPMLCTIAIAVYSAGCTSSRSNNDSNVSSMAFDTDTSVSSSNSTINENNSDTALSLPSSEQSEESSTVSSIMEFYIGGTKKYCLTLPAGVNWQMPSSGAGYTYAFDADKRYKGNIAVTTAYSFGFDDDMNDIIAYTANVDTDTVVIDKLDNVTINGIEMTIVQISYSYRNKLYDKTFNNAEYGYYFIINDEYVFVSCSVVNDNSMHDELNKMTGMLDNTVTTLSQM